MKKLTNVIVFIACLIFLLGGISGCGQKKKSTEPPKTTAAVDQNVTAASPSTKPAQLPVRYQSPGFVLPKDKLDETIIGGANPAGEYQIKVGATIRSTNGPQPLWDVMKRLANLKGMTVSWASDVDQNVLVDVDISATDDFRDAIANLLRQADYFHELSGKSIVIRNKTTKIFKISVPLMQGGYNTTVGGNFLSSKEASSSGTEGTVKITSADNKFNVWENIETNLKSILKISSTERKDISGASSDPKDKQAGDSKNATKNATGKDQGKKDQGMDTPDIEPTAHPARYSAKDEPYFVIDKSIGLITVTAKPALLDTVEKYLDNLKNHLFQQVNIEAKIVEVYLKDNSRIGIDWSNVLKNNTNNPLSGSIQFGQQGSLPLAGQVYPHSGSFASSFISRVAINNFNFNTLLNALNEQGDTHVLANPKITVLNGQPAVISVGKDVAYVKSVKRDESDSGSGGLRITFTAEVGNVVQGIALGVMASVVDKDKVVLHLTPITTDIENLLPDGSVATTTVGEGAIVLSLPQVKVREMSTMVEVQNGEMLIIGGLIDSLETKEEDFVPGLGNLPVLRYLFGVKEKKLNRRELVILLSPKII